MATLTTKIRNKLPKSAFGLPDQEKYPMKTIKDGKVVDSRSHAANAKARATQMVKAGKLSKEDEKKIDAKADRILNKTEPKSRTKKKSTAKKKTSTTQRMVNYMRDK